jgi:predicted transcriptional regulator
LDRGHLLKLTAEGVAAYVACHRVAPTELEVIIGSVAGSLAEVGDPPQVGPARAEPAVPVRRSVGKNHLICLVCGQKQKMLKRHLATRHQLSPADYRERYDLSSDYPLVAPSYAAQRSELARRIGLGRTPTWQSQLQRHAGEAQPGVSDEGQTKASRSVAQLSLQPRYSDKVQRILGLRPFLGDQGAAERHDQRDCGLVLGGFQVAGGILASVPLAAIHWVKAAGPPTAKGPVASSSTMQRSEVFPPRCSRRRVAVLGECSPQGGQYPTMVRNQD